MTTTTKVNHPILSLLGVCGGFAALFLVWLVATTPNADIALFFTSAPVDAVGVATTTPASISSQERREAFFEAEVGPALDAFDARNRAAVELAVERIADGFATYRAGVPLFVEDITSWSTRFGIAWRGGADFWKEWTGQSEQAVKLGRFVSGKFEEHVFSDAAIESMLAVVLTQFRDDIAASQNRLHADIKTAWAATGLDRDELDPDRLSPRVQNAVGAISAEMAQYSVVVGVASILVGELLTRAVQELVAILLANVATSVAASTATVALTSGGVMVKSMVAGGAGGSAVGAPGPGTLAGAAVGFVVGLLVDWWMTDKLAEKLTAECGQMVDGIEHRVLSGADNEPGLRAALAESIRILREAEKRAIHDALKEDMQ